jgi:hypothetical protein
MTHGITAGYDHLLQQSSKGVVMTKYLAIALLLTLSHTPSMCAAQPTSALLKPSDAFPQISGQSLTAKPFDLPAAVAGKPAVILFSFSKTAGKDAAIWGDNVSKAFSHAVPVYNVILLESVPGLFRGMATSSIKSGMPLPVQDHSIILLQNEALWKLRLAVADDTRAYALLLGPDSCIRWISSTSYSDSEFARLKAAISSVP